jgi:hypothetical protein
MKITKSQSLFQGPDDGQTEITCPACGGPAQFIDRMNRRAVFRCADSQCLGSVACQEGAA